MASQKGRRAKSAPPVRNASPGLTPVRPKGKQGTATAVVDAQSPASSRSAGRQRLSAAGLPDLRNAVNDSCPVRWWEGGARKSLLTAELLSLKNRLDKFKEGQQLHKLEFQQQLFASGRAHAFWSSPDLTSDTALPLAQQIGLKSACEAGGMAVTLWTYSKFIQGIPTIAPGSRGSLTTLHAGRVYSLDKALLLLRKGWKVQHIADLVRLSAAVTWRGPAETLAPGHLNQPRVARVEGAWAIDLDTIWFKPAQNFELQSRSGASFAMFPWSNQPKWINDHIRYWKLNYCRTPEDMMRLSFPMHLTTRQRQLVNNIVRKMENVAKKPAYGQVMNWLMEEIAQQGFGHDITPDWKQFNPVPPYMGQEKLFKANALQDDVTIQSIGGGIDIPAQAWILANSFAMNQYWCSTAGYNEKRQEMTKDGLQILINVEQDSLFLAILERMSLGGICCDGKLPMSLPEPEVGDVSAEAAPTEHDVETAQRHFPQDTISLAAAMPAASAGEDAPAGESTSRSASETATSDVIQDAPAAFPLNFAGERPPAPADWPRTSGRLALQALAIFEKNRGHYGLFNDLRTIAIVCKGVASVFWEDLLWQWQVHNGLHRTKGLLRSFGLSSVDVYQLLAAALSQWEMVSRPDTGLRAPFYNVASGQFNPNIGQYVDLALLLGAWALNAQHDRTAMHMVCDGILEKHGHRFCQLAYEVKFMPLRLNLRLRPRTGM